MEYYIINLTIGRSIDSYKCFGIITIACSTFLLKRTFIYLFIIFITYIYWKNALRRKQAVKIRCSINPVFLGRISCQREASYLYRVFLGLPVSVEIICQRKALYFYRMNHIFEEQSLIYLDIYLLFIYHIYFIGHLYLKRNNWILLENNSILLRKCKYIKREVG